MTRVDSRRKKQNRIIAAASTYHGPNGEKEIKERNKAAIREAKEASLEERISRAHRKCIQNIYPFEAEWKKLCKAKEKDEDKINEAYNNILKAIDKAGADSLARIIAEIKQPIPANKDTSKEKLIEVELPVDIFYSDFEKFCNKELQDIQIDQSYFNEIIDKYISLNLANLKSNGERYNYPNPAIQFEKNLNYLEKVAVKDLTPVL